MPQCSPIEGSLSRGLFPYRGNDARAGVCNIPLMRFPNNLRALQAAKDWTDDQAAEAMGLSRGGYLKLKHGENQLTSTTIAKAARGFGVQKSEVLPTEARLTSVVGMVGADTETSFFAEGQGPFDTVEAPPWANDTTVAVEIRGESLGASFDGWLIFYDDRREPVTDDLIGRLCVVGLADSRVLVKTISRGQLANRFNLSANVGPPIYDVEILWAALVKEMRPR